MNKIVIPLFLLLICIGCEKEKSYIASTEYDMDVVEEVAMEISAPAGEYDRSQTTLQALSDAETYEPKIIKTANLRFETDDLSATTSTIQQIVKKLNGQIQSDNEYKTSYSLRHSITVRVPSSNFDAFITEISNGVNYFDQKEISSRDVTEEYIDVEARIKAKQKLEERYLELLKKANKVKEMLEIERELSYIREEIEVKQGRLRYLQNRVSMSTINLEYYKTIEAKQGATISYGSKMWNAVKSGFNSVSSFFISLLYLWPFILIFVIVFILIRRRLKRKK